MKTIPQRTYKRNNIIYKTVNGIRVKCAKLMNVDIEFNNNVFKNKKEYNLFLKNSERFAVKQMREKTNIEYSVNCTYVGYKTGQPLNCDDKMILRFELKRID